MTHLGNGLASVGHREDTLSVGEAELSMLRRVGAPEEHILATQGNLAATYEELGRLESALQMKRDVYSGWLELYGEEHEMTLISANNYTWGLIHLQRFGEAKSLMRKKMPVARRVLGKNHEIALRMRWGYAEALYMDDGATLDDLREAVTTLEDVERTARRVFGGAHPTTTEIEKSLQNARAALRARETPPRSA